MTKLVHHFIQHYRPLSFLFLHANAAQMRASNSKRQSSLAQIRFFTLPSLTLTKHGWPLATKRSHSEHLNPYGAGSFMKSLPMAVI
jgi:hypothetical protein